jgi:hypothetical protein
MLSLRNLLTILPVFVLLLIGCAQTKPDIPVDQGSIERS